QHRRQDDRRGARPGYRRIREAACSQTSPAIGRLTATCNRALEADMAIVVDEASAEIKFDWKGVKPAIDANREERFCHLTKGFHLPRTSFDPLKISDAWTAEGQVRVSVGAGDKLDDWKFGFLQLVRVNKLMVFFAGRTRKDGSTALSPVGELISDGL